MDGRFQRSVAMIEPPMADSGDEMPYDGTEGDAEQRLLGLLDLPSDCLDVLLERCSVDALYSLVACCHALSVPVKATVCSLAWRQRAHNLEDLCLRRLQHGGFESETLRGLSGGVRALCIHGDLMVSASKDNVARLWGLRSIGTCFAEFVHPQWVGSCALSPRGLLATGCDDGHVRVFRTALAEQATPPVVLRGASRSWITGVGWSSADGDASEQALVSCSRDGELCVWDPSRWRQPGDDERALLAHEFERPVAQPGARSSCLVPALDVWHATCVFPRSVSSATAEASGQVWQARAHRHRAAPTPLLPCPRRDVRVWGARGVTSACGVVGWVGASERRGARAARRRCSCTPSAGSARCAARSASSCRVGP